MSLIFIVNKCKSSSRKGLKDSKLTREKIERTTSQRPYQLDVLIHVTKPQGLEGVTESEKYSIFPPKKFEKRFNK
uniref:Uncharacterized protein n=1 Tax=Romanomermis culicivorax TaxID=13658 RepID=A0A915IFD3_ROMCU